ncbi:MAG: hypothetical protein ACLFPL_03805 [Candidatus Nanoarchaeia archaeon]
MKEKDLKKIQREAETIFSSYGACPNHPDVVFEEPEPRQFSFNSPFGACSTCLGIGSLFEFDERLIIPNREESIANGAVAMWNSKTELNWQVRGMSELFRKHQFDVFIPIKELTKEQFEALMHGDNEIVRRKNYAGREVMDIVWEGVIPQARRLFHQTESQSRKEHFQKFMSQTKCPTCKGKRLKENMLSVKIDGKNIIETTELSVEKAIAFFQSIGENMSEKDKFIAKQILKEIIDRLEFLNNVGLSYLNLSRSAGTLSGGEAQRIRLATQIGAQLTGVLYVLDEPSIGLHQRDNEKLIGTLKQLRDLGNTLIVVEHDEDTMMASDHLIDMGPGAGVEGGHIVASGTPQRVMNNKNSLTGKFLKGEEKIEIPKKRRAVNL